MFTLLPCNEDGKNVETPRVPHVYPGRNQRCRDHNQYRGWRIRNQAATGLVRHPLL